MPVENRYNLMNKEEFMKLTRLIKASPRKLEISMDLDIPDPPRKKRTTAASEMKYKTTTSIPRIKYNTDKIIVPKRTYKANLDLEERIFTIDETIKFLKISRTSLWRLRKCGKMPYYQIGSGTIRFKLSEILNFLNYAEAKMGNTHP